MKSNLPSATISRHFPSPFLTPSTECHSPPSVRWYVVLRCSCCCMWFSFISSSTLCSLEERNTAPIALTTSPVHHTILGRRSSSLNKKKDSLSFLYHSGRGAPWETSLPEPCGEPVLTRLLVKASPHSCQNSNTDFWHQISIPKYSFDNK